jgi:hypothetical protein
MAGPAGVGAGSGKRSIALDLKDPADRAIAHGGVLRYRPMSESGNELLLRLIESSPTWP